MAIIPPAELVHLLEVVRQKRPEVKYALISPAPHNRDVPAKYRLSEILHRRGYQLCIAGLRLPLISSDVCLDGLNIDGAILDFDPNDKAPGYLFLGKTRGRAKLSEASMERFAKLTLGERRTLFSAIDRYGWQEHIDANQYLVLTSSNQLTINSIIDRQTQHVALVAPTLTVAVHQAHAANPGSLTDYVSPFGRSDSISTGSQTSFEYSPPVVNQAPAQPIYDFQTASSILRSQNAKRTLLDAKATEIAASDPKRPRRAEVDGKENIAPINLLMPSENHTSQAISGNPFYTRR